MSKVIRYQVDVTETAPVAVDAAWPKPAVAEKVSAAEVQTVTRKALADVAALLEDAMRVLRRLPMPREVTGMQKTTASILAQMAEAAEQEGQLRPRPTAQAIDRAWMVVECLQSIRDQATRDLLVYRAVGLRWSAVVLRLGWDCSVRTAQRRHEEALGQMLCILLTKGTKKG